jgi:DNA-binding PadR family transcriptional regulator
LVAKTGKALTNTGRVLLGMIAEGHGTGYAIKAEIERSTRLYWGASIGGIYPELRRLEQAGLVSARENFRGGARRHAYALTASGREALHDWLTDHGEPLLEMRHEALLRLRFAGVLPVAEQLQVVRRMRAVHARRIAELQQRLAAAEFDDPLHRVTIEFGVGWNMWARDWCEELERTIADQSGLAAPAQQRAI